LNYAPKYAFESKDTPTYCAFEPQTIDRTKEIQPIIKRWLLVHCMMGNDPRAQGGGGGDDDEEKHVQCIN
jgi:hypothetical protein